MFTLARRIGLLQAVVATLFVLFALSVASTYLTQIGNFNLLTTPVVSSFLVQYAAMPHWLGVFACGIACSLIYTYATKVYPTRMAAGSSIGALWTQRSGNRALLLGVFLLILLSTAPFLRDVWMQQVLFGLGYAGILLGVLFGSPVLRWPLANPVMRFVGLISYSFYIWHHAALVVLGPKLHGALAGQYHTIVLFVIGLAITIPIAYVSYQLFERPFIAVRRRSHELVDQPVERMTRPADRNVIGASDQGTLQFPLRQSLVSLVSGIASWRQLVTQCVRRVGERDR
jgi:peptidoglycan/LPS O-acetylase OafA/YrhL